jgi:hypothetical protein
MSGEEPGKPPESWISKNAGPTPEEQFNPSEGLTDPAQAPEALNAEESAPEALAPEDWMESPELGWAAPGPAEMADYEGLMRRVGRAILLLGAIGSLAALWRLGWPLAAGMAVGTLAAWLNFRWLAQSVNAIGERIVHAGSREKGRAAVVRGIGRIFLIAIVAYGIFSCSVRGLVGFLAGLAMPVLALMCEAAYEVLAARRRSI